MPEAQLSVLRVLILDDSEEDAVLVVRALRQQGYDVRSTRAWDGPGMRAALSGVAWDIVISDYTMPAFSVAEALSILREYDMDVPFILVSGSVGEELAVATMKAGAHDFFLKDRLTRLGSAIERELREAGIRRERREASARLLANEQELRRAVQVRDEFLSIASHELRTPLTPLLLQLQSALRAVRKPQPQTAAGLAEELQPKLEKALRHVERMTLLITNLLDVTRITSGRLDVTRQRVDLQEVVVSVSKRLRETMRTGDVRIATGVGAVGMWDPVAIESIVANLLSNAIKYGEGKAIDVSVEATPDEARLTVADRGIGIAPADQQRVFERFERAVPSEHYGGFGVGLWIAVRLAKAHGGTIRVSSEKGKGSTFVLDLPFAAPASTTPDGPP